MIKFYALCGMPEAGKTEVQKILEKLYGIKPLDDSRRLRDAAKILYNLSEDDVTTQEGKRRVIQVGETSITVREALGKLGDYLEGNDPLHIPRMAKLDAQSRYKDLPVSFGSIRKQQAVVFKDPESLVIEVVRPGLKIVNNFDHYEKSLVDVVIHNNFDPTDLEGSSHRLIAEVQTKIDKYTK